MSGGRGKIGPGTLGAFLRQRLRLARAERQVAAGIERYEASVGAEFRRLLRRGRRTEGGEEGQG